MAIYHLNVKTGTRIGGQSAKAKSDYIEREGKYERPTARNWNTKNPPICRNGPRTTPRNTGRRQTRASGPTGGCTARWSSPYHVELNERERVEVASSFAKTLTGEERLPYTLAIHRGGEDGGNPHAHLMFSERTHDGIERSAAQWFKRYNAQEPEKGGARKTTSTKPREWLENTREQWADHANEALDRAGRPERINEASLENQYFEAAEAGDERAMAHLNREPGVHIGPHNVARAMRGEDLDRVTEAGDAEARRGVQWIEAALEFVDQKIRELTEQIADRVREGLNRPGPEPEPGGGFDRSR